MHTKCQEPIKSMCSHAHERPSQNCLFPRPLQKLSLAFQFPRTCAHVSRGGTPPPRGRSLLSELTFCPLPIFESRTYVLCLSHEIKNTLKIFNNHFITDFKHCLTDSKDLVKSAGWEHSRTPPHTGSKPAQYRSTVDCLKHHLSP